MSTSDGGGVGMIRLTETNVHWKRSRVTSNFNKILKETWLKDKIGTCVSELKLPWNLDYKR